MKLRMVLRAVLACLLMLPFSIAYGASVHGTVKNGTTGKVAPDVEIILIQLQGGMQPVQNTKTDTQGKFAFDYPAIGTQPMLLRAVYRGVMFHEPLPPGQNDVQVEIFEPSRDPKTITIGTHFVIFQPNGATLQVGEEYAIRNDSKPAQAFFREDGDFDFAVPDGATLKQAAAQGPSGMPVVQTPIEHGKDRYSVAYAFRPGDNGVRYSYDLPYTGNAATVKLPTVYPGARLVVVAPPSVQISGEGLQSGGQEQGMNVFSRDGLAANSTVSVSVSGTAPPASTLDADGEAASGQGGRDAQQGSNASAGVPIQVAPARIDVLRWPLLAGFLCVFVLLAFVLARKPVATMVGGGASDGANSLAHLTPKAAVAPVASANLAAVDAAVGNSLDSLKDTLFRLELRRQAGTISEDDYNQERARAEKILRDLVRG